MPQKKQKKSSAPPETVELYNRLIKADPRIELKGASMPYTALNGNMFSYLHPSGAMALRLGAEEREKFLKKYKTTLFHAYGVIQKEYVTVPDALLRNTKELGKYLALSYEKCQEIEA